MTDRYAEGLRRAEEIDDLVTHREAWRVALEKVHSKTTNDADESYWAHELDVFDRTFARVAEILASIPPDPLPMASEDEAIAKAFRATLDETVEGDYFTNEDDDQREYLRIDGRIYEAKFIPQLRAQLAARNLTITALSDRQMLVEALEGMLKLFGRPLPGEYVDGGASYMLAMETVASARAALAKAKGA
jgi:hypothetical protein